MVWIVEALERKDKYSNEPIGLFHLCAKSDEGGGFVVGCEHDHSTAKEAEECIVARQRMDLVTGIPLTTDATEAASQATMGFGPAIEALKDGLQVSRAGWNGKGMFLFLVSGGDLDHPALPETVEQLPYIAMKTVPGPVVPWLASQTDVLAVDWTIVQPDKAPVSQGAAA